MSDYICHCNVSANDGVGHISSKPTIYVKSNNTTDAKEEAISQLIAKYEKLGCNYVSVNVSLLKEI